MSASHSRFPYPSASGPRFFHVTVRSFLWFDIVATAALAIWVVARFPGFGPKSVRAAAVCFLVAQLVPNIGLAFVPLVIRLPYGQFLVLAGITSTVLFALFLAAAWLLRALMHPVGGPRGGHPVHRFANTPA